MCELAVEIKCLWIHVYTHLDTYTCVYMRVRGGAGKTAHVEHATTHQYIHLYAVAAYASCVRLCTYTATPV